MLCSKTLCSFLSISEFSCMLLESSRVWAQSMVWKTAAARSSDFLLLPLSSMYWSSCCLLRPFSKLRYCSTHVKKTEVRHGCNRNKKAMNSKQLTRPNVSLSDFSVAVNRRRTKNRVGQTRVLIGFDFNLERGMTCADYASGERKISPLANDHLLTCHLILSLAVGKY